MKQTKQNTKNELEMRMHKALENLVKENKQGTCPDSIFYELYLEAGDNYKLEAQKLGYKLG